MPRANSNKKLDTARYKMDEENQLEDSNKLDEGRATAEEESTVKRPRFMVENVESPPTSPTNETRPDSSTFIDVVDTIGYATHEAVPMTVFYRNEASLGGVAQQRPTLDELHKPKGYDDFDEQELVN